ncbi:MAG: hypothetical protein M3128_10355 [Verrucomicrobiota bacterium]|nr:hypothetical protein [Verrucomicrobiota bacterium]
MTVLVVSCWARESAPSATTTSPFAPVAFLVGGLWRGDLPPTPDGKKMSIELRCDWAANHQGIRFDGAFVVDGKRAPYTSGIYNWNAAKKQLVFTYSDAEGNLIEGAVTIENGALVHNFTSTDSHGKIEKARAIITSRGADAYTNDIFVEKDGGLQKMVSVKYERARTAKVILRRQFINWCISVDVRSTKRCAR